MIMHIFVGGKKYLFLISLSLSLTTVRISLHLGVCGVSELHSDSEVSHKFSSQSHHYVLILTLLSHLALSCSFSEPNFWDCW